MPSTPPPQTLSIKNQTPSSTPKLRPTSRRTLSLSSSSRSNSSDSSLESSPFLLNHPSPPPSPITPLNLIRIPFSWEKTPGIPKKTEPSGPRLLLPPPPAAAKKWRSQEEKKHLHRSKKDPFFAAMMECSKDDDCANIWNKGSLSDRFGFISMYTSCKKTCAISESIVYVPRSSR
ncbi:uncharacterized protein LOC125224153 [Salvia hispanica]|uniref:uncharacterized protein LOC125224153 n=1 Tax=Salvia hispanica TaxID=49212 RepID=UPI0020098611|nr:uncharacterized protein LOC125224153 [Salvia hispanica]